MHYDYLIVGSGLFGSVFAHQAHLAGKTCLVVDRRKHIGGNLYTEERDGINVHIYGAHIFHTSDKKIWDWINQFAQFNNYINSPVANFKGRLFNLPFNMNTFYQMWGEEASTPEKALKKIESQKVRFDNPSNLEEQALSLIGRDIYETLIKGYTEKQWGRDAKELPADIIKRIPVRMRFDNNYFSDRYQGIPEGGYTAIISKLLRHADVELGVEFSGVDDSLCSKADKVLYTGTLDSFFGFRFGKLVYRSEVFEHVRLKTPNYQGNAVVNYTDRETPYTRIIEHKHFEFGEQPVTWISYEYPVDYSKTGEPYYPVNDSANTELYGKYRALAEKEDKLLIGGRLAEYRYYDMAPTIASALALSEKEFR